jgi:hypothetical protein
MADENEDKGAGWKESVAGGVVGASNILNVVLGTGHPTESGLEPSHYEEQYAHHYEQQVEEGTAQGTELGYAIQADEDRPAEHDEPPGDSGGSWFALSTDDDGDDDEDDDGDDD